MWDWLKKAGNNIGTAIKNVVNSDVVQNVAGALGFGAIAETVQDVVNGGKKEIQTVAQVVQEPVNVQVQEVVNNETALEKYMPLIIGGGFGMGLLLILSKR